MYITNIFFIQKLYQIREFSTNTGVGGGFIYLGYYIFMKHLKTLARFLSYIILAVGIFLIAEGLMKYFLG